jgi:hypothetical protein
VLKDVFAACELPKQESQAGLSSLGMNLSMRPPFGVTKAARKMKNFVVLFRTKMKEFS